MPPRSSWKGHLRLSLVSVPVQAISAAQTGGGKIHLNQLHAECHSRIKYQKVCPIHGEVSSSEIVSGYEYSKGKYVVIDPEEIDQLRTEGERAINIDTFIEPSEVDPLYFDGRTYYLIPDGAAGQKPYAVLYEGMQQQQRYAVGQVVFSGREQLVLVRPLEGLLMMSMLSYEYQIRKPEMFQEEVASPKVTKEELRLAQTLIQASSSDHLDLSKYQDVYNDRMTELIEAKVEGREIVAPPDEEETPVINLMDALKKSVAQAKGPKAGKAAKKPPKKMAPSRRKTAATKRKTS